MKIGICGTGRMGAAMAQRLLSLGHEVTVWNRTAGRTGPLAEAGARVAATPAAMAAACDVIVTMLSDAAAAEAVHGGPDGLRAADLSGRLLVEMSTLMPDDQRRLGAAAIACGAGYVDCPVGGTVGPAREGKLIGLMGGSDADAARARPVLEMLCRRVEHVGPVGAGAAMKLAVNLPLVVYWQALGEALALVKPLGLAPERFVDIMADTSGAAAAMKARSAAVAKLLAGGDAGAPGYDIALAAKDLEAMAALGRDMGAAMPVTDAARAAYEQARAAGAGSADVMAMPGHAAQRHSGRS